MDPEEEWNRDRMQARARNEAARLRALAGDPAAAQDVADAWEPLLPREPLVVSLEPLPYDAPDLLP
jgi:hypothetical protein